MGSWRSAGALVLVVGVGAAACGSEAQPAKESAAGASARVTKTLGEQEVRGVLPGPSDVPEGWRPRRAPEVRGQGEGGSVGFARRGYQAPDLDGVVGFGLHSFSSAKTSRVEFAGMQKRSESSLVKPVRLDAVDEVIASKYCLGPGCFTFVQFRIGAVNGWVNLNVDDHPAADPKVLNPLVRMFAERVRQVQQGEEPTASAR
ncbi:hypothetical protein [Streptomyces flavofungini]|uniref:hypothetical protein n=1 Tax=Streptomyces flavofungini TaxID=68200 RepID=UPI0025B0F23B|nr:hypothetical protein [Streptomyces flavofungini]WJV51756.1 hypothetical protein QUY26_39705 [Streptomyces flavofungini]